MVVVRATSQGLELRRHDAGGKLLGGATVIPRPEPVRDVAAAAVGQRLGVAYVEGKGATGEARALIASTRGTGVTADYALGATSLPPRPSGGLVTLRAEDGELLAFRSGKREACADDPALQCTHFEVQALGDERPEPRRTPLLVPMTCAHGLAAFSATEGQWLYGVCSEKKGRPETTLFRIQFSPRYAAAQPVFPGCSPRGSAVVDGGVVVVADCPDGPRAVRSQGATLPLLETDWRSAALECERGAPALVAFGARTPLSKIDGDLSALLPDKWAADGARAVYTGVALLIARSTTAADALERFECRAGQLARAE